MPQFTVLSDAIVHDLLIGLSRAEILSVRDELEQCLKDFSNGNERDYQLPPAVVTRPNGQKALFRPFTSPEAVGAKIVVDPAPVPDSNGSGSCKPPLRGIIALCDENGLPTGVINAEEATGYRTSLTALIPYLWRRNTQNIVVFGAGKQALWHIRLALALRGSEISSVTVVNRSGSRAMALLDQVKEENPLHWRSPTQFTFLDSSSPGYGQSLAESLSRADAIFCTVPSTKPLFPLKYLTEGRQSGTFPFISAIGSWQSDMIELDPEILTYTLKLAENFESDSHAKGMILTDDISEALIKSGEFIQSGIVADQITEIGQLLEENRSLVTDVEHKAVDLCLEEGLVVYKVIGVSVTDLATGNAILSLARKRDLGVVIKEF